MAQYQRIDPVPLPKKRPHAYTKAQNVALKVAKLKGQWAPVYWYKFNARGQNSAKVRARELKKTAAWIDTGVFQTAVRADLNNEPRRWIVYVRCLERHYKNGTVAVYVQPEQQSGMSSLDTLLGDDDAES